MSLNSNKRLQQLDILRAVAVFLVFGNHMTICPPEVSSFLNKLTTIWYRGGWVGVDLFFVLSGLVLSLKLINQNIEITTQFMNQYLVKRILRLYPALLFTLIFYVYLQYNSTDAFQIFEEALLIRGKHVLLLPDWTLGVEMASFSTIYGAYHPKK